MSTTKNNDFFERFESSSEIRRAYYYLLGQYLGDGHISKNSRTMALRISATSKYQGIIREIMESMELILPCNKVYISNKTGCKSVTINSNHLPILFPQHGEGAKHTRKIELVEWQVKYLEENSKYLARGLFHSDGSYYGNDRKFYNFTNCSLDIHIIYQKCLELNDVEFRFNSKKVSEKHSPAWVTVMYRKSEVDKAYQFLGEKT